MRKPSIAMKLTPKNYAGVINLGNRVVTALTGNANFGAPSPTLVNLQAAVTDAETAYAVWSPLGNRGSHASLGDLRNKVLTLFNLLKAEAQYCQNTVLITYGSDYDTMQAVLLTSGFDLANVPTPHGVLNPVKDFSEVVSANLNPNQVKFRWRKPLGASKDTVYIYRVLRGATTVFANAVEITTTSRTEFIDTNDTAAVQTYTYWIVAVNNAGDGAASGAITVSILP